ncbi:NAD(P)/FAD-dependent oxidoreductase [Oscillatoria sp. FACHB-1406]|uniref:geranylgeranyl reductase family protein n=1 Tax=Oscillatoria sp. FACHB-1406 TaxID=2692846 RepID=UPI001683CC76|nr:NAD(P)/FAD-dependent oxidoreductase [Oscillatoria sp. FACHB-1406]MBD2578687.1 NAD(P)/FAD-dependent oxidoreductase [Oscillatoria sp. FACHB-1406]
MVDCIIVGSGPAGSAAAYHLAKRGHSVLVLEKESLPRYKACAGGVSPAVADWFDFDFSPVINAKVSQVNYTWQMGDPMAVELTTQPMWMVQRDTFDNFLLEKAKAAGAQVQDSTAVTALKFNNGAWQVTTNNGNFEGRYLIAADGATGPCAKLLGFKEIKPYTAGVLEIDSPPKQSDTAKFDFGTLKNGFIWAFPKGDRISIAAGVVGSHKANADELEKQLKTYASELGFNLANSQYRQQPMILWSENRTLHAQNALLAGDAAGVADPLLAEGIRPAMFTGVKAAEAISKALGGDGSALANYTKTIAEGWGNDMVWAQRLAGLFFKFPKIAYKVGVKRPAAAEVMSKILCGEMRYGEIADKATKVLKRSFLPGQG